MVRVARTKLQTGRNRLPKGDQKVRIPKFVCLKCRSILGKIPTARVQVLYRILASNLTTAPKDLTHAGSSQSIFTGPFSTIIAWIHFERRVNGSKTSKGHLLLEISILLHFYTEARVRYFAVNYAGPGQDSVFR
jgi:hypothetical protein